MQNIIT